MNRAIVDQINKSIINISQRYYKQIYVNEYGIGNNVAFFSNENSYLLLNLNLVLSEELKDVPFKRRPFKAVNFLDELILDAKSEIVCIDNFEVLFEPSLKINPFELLTKFSKSKTLIIAWRGTILNDHFIYAEPGHPEYIKFPTKDALIIQ